MSGGAYMILAPGEEGGITPGPFSTDQGKLYNALIQRSRAKCPPKRSKGLPDEKFGPRVRSSAPRKPVAPVSKSCATATTYLTSTGKRARTSCSLRLGRRRGPRAVLLKLVSGPPTPQRSTSPASTSVRPAAHTTLVHPERRSDQLRRKPEGVADRKRARRRTGH